MEAFERQILAFSVLVLTVGIATALSFFSLPASDTSSEYSTETKQTEGRGGLGQFLYSRTWADDGQRP